MGIEDMVPQDCPYRVKMLDKIYECLRPSKSCNHYITDKQKNISYCIPYTDKDVISLVKYFNFRYENSSKNKK